MVTTTYQIKMPTSRSIIGKYGLGPGGRTQLFFMNEIIRSADSFVPFRAGPLKNQINRSQDGTYYEHIVPYARVHWYGKLMVGPGLPKKPTDIDMNYRGAPKRGPEWVERMWAIDKEVIENAVEKFMLTKGGSI